MPRFFFQISAIFLALASVPAHAAFAPEKLALVDRPFEGDQLALSPDGQYLAYTGHRNGQYVLILEDLEEHEATTIPLPLGGANRPGIDWLRHLRWATKDKLILEELSGDVLALTPGSDKIQRLWASGDDGLINDLYANFPPHYFWPVPTPARILLPIPGDADHILIESSAQIMSGDRLANLFKADIRDGKLELMHRKHYIPFQIALYGPGNNLIAYPQRIRTSAPAELLDPSYGAPVNPESSQNGIMLYDREGRPRLLYEKARGKEKRRYSYVQPGFPPFDPNIVPVSLDRALGQQGYWESTFGKRAEFEIRPDNYFGERSYPIAFDFNPDVVFVASAMGRDTYGIYSLNLKTKVRVDLAPGNLVDLAPADPESANDILVFDETKRKLVGIRYVDLRPQTFWIDADLGELQRKLDAMLPKRTVEILAWDASRRRFVVRTSSEQDPGGIFIYDRAENRLELVTLRAPWLAGQKILPSTPFTFDTPTGTRLTGYLTLPTESKVDPPPLLIYCAPGLWDRAAPGFNREAEMLADMGLVVMRLNYRGTAGFGRKHLMAVQEGIDTVPLEDFGAAIRWLSSLRSIDLKRVVVMGEGFGGYLALRAVKNHPELFRAAISVNAPTNLKSWAGWQEYRGARPMASIPGASLANINADAAAADPNAPVVNMSASPSSNPLLAESGMLSFDFRSLVREAFLKGAKNGEVDIAEEVQEGNFRKPVLLVSNKDSGDITPLASSFLGRLGFGIQGMTLRRLSINGDFVNGSISTRTRVFQEIEEFINEFLYTYDAEIGELKELPGKPVKK